MFRTLSITLTLAALLSGCAHVDAAGELRYADDAEKNYALGQKALEDSRYLDALKYFEHVRYKFPYSTQAALADLAVADTAFEQEKYLEAVEGYRGFIKLRPNHPKTDYAEFRVALSHY
jgi:outer membrane protein assembly factor BamD